MGEMEIKPYTSCTTDDVQGVSEPGLEVVRSRHRRPEQGERDGFPRIVDDVWGFKWAYFVGLFCGPIFGAKNRNRPIFETPERPF
jgi:hypothetical protein